MITDSLYKVFLCGGKIEDFEYQTCTLPFTVEVEKDKNKNKNSLVYKKGIMTHLWEDTEIFSLHSAQVFPKRFPLLFSNLINLDFQIFFSWLP